MNTIVFTYLFLVVCAINMIFETNTLKCVVVKYNTGNRSFGHYWTT